MADSRKWWLRGEIVTAQWGIVAAQDRPFCFIFLAATKMGGMNTSDPYEIKRRKPKKSQRIIALIVILAMVLSTFIAALAVALGQ